MGIPAAAPKTGSRLLNAIAIVVCILLVPVIIANIVIIAQSFLNPDEPPGFLGYKPFIVLSGSMLPTIESGDLVIVKETDTAVLKEGDVIAFREGNAVITHRIVKVAEENGQKRFTTKGDNNNSDDPVTVSEGSVQGLYLYSIPMLGSAALFIQTPAGMLAAIALPLTLIIIYYILSRRRLDREKHAKTTELEQELEKMRRKLSTLEEDKNDSISNDST